MQRTPVQSTEKRVAPEVTDAFPPQTDFPLRDESSDEGPGVV